MVDFYSANPLAEMVAERDPARYAAVTRVSEPPKLFGNGTSDTPAFCASGIDPQSLLKLPLGLRHAAAEEPDINRVYSMFEDYAGIPDAEYDSPGLRAAKLRMESWMRDTDTRTPEEIAQHDAAMAAEFETLRRTWDREGKLPEEREAERQAAWQAKQDLRAYEAEQRREQYEADLKARGVNS